MTGRGPAPKLSSGRETSFASRGMPPAGAGAGGKHGIAPRHLGSPVRSPVRSRPRSPPRARPRRPRDVDRDRLGVRVVVVVVVPAGSRLAGAARRDGGGRGPDLERDDHDQGPPGPRVRDDDRHRRELRRRRGGPRRPLPHPRGGGGAVARHALQRRHAGGRDRQHHAVHRPGPPRLLRGAGDVAPGDVREPRAGLAHPDARRDPDARGRDPQPHRADPRGARRRRSGLRHLLDAVRGERVGLRRPPRRHDVQRDGVQHERPRAAGARSPRRASGGAGAPGRGRRRPRSQTGATASGPRGRHPTAQARARRRRRGP